jgi:hypothetical protein
MSKAYCCNDRPCSHNVYIVMSRFFYRWKPAQQGTQILIFGVCTIGMNAVLFFPICQNYIEAISSIDLIQTSNLLNTLFIHLQLILKKQDIRNLDARDSTKSKNCFKASYGFNLFHRIAIECAAAVCANVNAPIFFGITGNMQQKSPLVLIVVDAHPTLGLIDRTENAALSVYHTN